MIAYTRWPAMILSFRKSTILLGLLPLLLMLLLEYPTPGASQPRQVRGGWDWMTRDAYDEFIDEFNGVTAYNCRPQRGTQLRADTISQLPRFNTMLEDLIYYNRTRLLHMHTQTHRRAFFLSYIFQRLNTSREDFRQQPGQMYYYLGAAADVTANPNTLNGSAVYFDNNVCYANWYRTLLFNKTLPLFGPRAYKFDDYVEPYNWLREPSNSSLNVIDMGTGPNSNYTSPLLRTNPWYYDQEMKIDFLPDYGQGGTDRKFQYYVKIKEVNPTTGRWLSNNFDSFDFFGPPYPGQKDTFLPVRFTKPYFDCGHMNRWIFSSVAPIVDFMPRYSPYNHIRRPRFVGLAVMDTELIRLDINPCPRSPGNPPPNRFEGTARCKPTTRCEPIPNWGLERRGGYFCMCQPGYRLPYWQQGPFMGVDIEQATEAEYQAGFDCIKVNYRQVWPVRLLDPSAGSNVINEYPYNPGNEAIQELVQSQTSSQRSSQVKALEQPAQSTEQPAQSTEANANEKRVRRHVRSARSVETGAAADPEGVFVANLLGDSRANGSASRNLAASHPDQLQPELTYEEEPPEGVQPAEGQPNEVGGRRVASDREIREALAGGQGALEHLKSSRAATGHVPASEESESRGMRKRNGLADQTGELASPGSGSDSAKKRYRREIGYLARYTSTDVDQKALARVLEMMAQKDRVTRENCGSFPPDALVLPGAVAYDIERQFDNQARTALRLAHFISAFLQSVDPSEVYGNYIGDSRLNEHQLFGEVLSGVMSDPYLLSTGVFWDRHQFGAGREFFGPYAYKKYDFTVSNRTGQQTDQSATNSFTPNTFWAVDYAGYGYETERWFLPLKQRWASNVYGLKRYLTKPLVRADMQGSELKRFERFPIYFRAPTIEDGFWSEPYFECGLLNDWVVTYSVPFFGPSRLNQLEFKGVVTATIFLNLMDINQCPQPFYVPNAFKGTAVCDFTSTYCTRQDLRAFRLGSYKCECRQGYEYPFADERTWYFEGSTVHSEYLKMQRGEQNMYRLLKCREAGAIALFANTLLVVPLVILALLTSRLAVF